ncbi:MAG: hypothetical protein HY820_14170 [Acidobacteria bacterium]|nr:hypothetical protein [Acidobacteriota bacterium]
MPISIKNRNLLRSVETPEDSGLLNNAGQFPNPFDLTAALSLTPDPIQSEILAQDPARCIINCSRQWGKSTITAVKAVHHALTRPDTLTLVLSPSARQSAEFLRKVKTYLDTLEIPYRGDGHNAISAQLPNSSRIIGLPGNEDTVRGFSNASLLIVDEASRVSDALYQSVRPAIATCPDARIWLLSTPNGRSGFFYNTFIGPDTDWTRFSVPANKCNRISQKFLEETRQQMDDYTFRQEFSCEFVESADTVFPAHILETALCDVPPLTIHTTNVMLFEEIDNSLAYPPSFIIGLDLGQSRDYTAICILECACVKTGFNRVYWTDDLAKRYTIRHLERMPLQTSYTDIVRRVASLTRHPSISHNCRIVVDATGVGKPVVDIFRDARLEVHIYPVLLTPGHSTTYNNGMYHVPRRELLSKLEIGLQTKTLKISRRIPAAPTLIHELSNLKRTIRDSGDGHIEPRRSTHHDDLVFAAALSFWKAATQ